MGLQVRFEVVCCLNSEGCLKHFSKILLLAANGFVTNDFVTND